MQNDSADEVFWQAYKAALNQTLPLGCRVWWARGVLRHHRIVGQADHTLLQVTDVDAPGKTFELRLQEVGGVDFAEGDAVSVFGRVALETQVNELPRLILNHNTRRWFPVLLRGGAGYFRSWRQQHGRLDFGPLYQETVNRVRQWASENHDRDLHWELKRRG